MAGETLIAGQLPALALRAAGQPVAPRGMAASIPAQPAHDRSLARTGKPAPDSR